MALPGDGLDVTDRLPRSGAKACAARIAAVGAEALIGPHAAPVPVKDIHWYPAIPAGLEEMEGRVLDRVKAAN